METAIILMSKTPRSGYSKTRLMNPLSGVECAEFHLACLRDVGLALRRSQLPGYIYYVDKEQTEFPFIPELAGLNVRSQAGNNLGERMFMASKEVLEDYPKVILIGADLPDITSEFLLQASEQLNNVDVVLGPAADGGYYLIGLKYPRWEIFADVPWGSAEVLASTLGILGELQLTVQLLPKKNDIDTWDDLVGFYGRATMGGETALTKLAAFASAAEYIARYGRNDVNVSKARNIRRSG